MLGNVLKKIKNGSLKKYEKFLKEFFEIYRQMFRITFKKI